MAAVRGHLCHGTLRATQLVYIVQLCHGAHCASAEFGGSVVQAEITHQQLAHCNPPAAPDDVH
jgi:hypothetical protein